VKHRKECEFHAEAAWSFTLTVFWGCKDMHYIEENNEVPKGKTKTECVEIIYSTTEGRKFL